MIKDLLLWEKYRPNTIEECILPDRILKTVSQGMVTNLLFYGTPGCGKTSLANIIAEDYSTKIIQVSINTGVDTLREEITDFVDGASLFDEGKKGLKLIYLNEFDRATPAFQDALNAYIEGNHKKVRFIATCNHINKISDALQSRFATIKFAAVNEDEKKQRMVAFLKRCQDICVKENISIETKDLSFLIKRNFPDFRKVMNALQIVKLTGNSSIMNGTSTTYEDLYKMVTNINVTSEQDMAYVMANFLDTPEEILLALSSIFFEWLTHTHPNMENKKANLLEIINRYTSWLPTVLDPVVFGSGLMASYRETLYKK